MPWLYQDKAESGQPGVRVDVLGDVIADTCVVTNVAAGFRVVRQCFSGVGRQEIFGTPSVAKNFRTCEVVSSIAQPVNATAAGHSRALTHILAATTALQLRRCAFCTTVRCTLALCVYAGTRIGSVRRCVARGWASLTQWGPSTRPDEHSTGSESKCSSN